MLLGQLTVKVASITFFIAPLLYLLYNKNESFFNIKERGYGLMVIYDPGAEHRIMVCVTPQKSCERLIKRGAARAKETGGQFAVVYVNKKKELNRELKEEKVLLELFEKAKANNGTVSILSGENVYNTLASFAKQNKVTHIIVGKSLRSAFEIQKHGEIINSLIKAVGENDINVEVVR